MQLLGKLRQVLGQQKQYSVAVNNLTVPILFKYSSIAALEKFITDNIHSADKDSIGNLLSKPIFHKPDLTVGRASAAQQRLYIHDELYKLNNNIHTNSASILYNMPFVYSIKCQSLDVNLLEQCFKLLLHRYSTLRSYFHYDQHSQQLNQHVMDSNKLLFSIEYSEVENRYSAVEDKIRSVSQRQFDLNYYENPPLELYSPLIVVSIIGVSKGDSIVNHTDQRWDAKHYSQLILLYNVHHIAFDGVSNNIFLNELQTLYNNSANLAILPALPCTYIDYAMYENNEIGSKTWQLAHNYWLNHIKPILGVDNKVNNSCVQLIPPHYNNNSIRPLVASTNISIPTNIIQTMQSFTDEYKLSLFQLLLGLYFLWLHKITGKSIICVGK
jgi:hypothetical protein